MPRIFADTAFYIALLNRRDALHARAALVAHELDASYVQLVTSQAVIFEVLAYFSRAGAQPRSRARDWVVRTRASAATEIVGVSDALLDAAIALYGSRLDKRYSLTDCVGMLICRERRIRDVLTTDRDFEAEGFTILLKD